MRINSKGQVTIPKRLRLRLGLLPNTEVVFEEADDGVLIRPVVSLRDLMEERLRNASGAAAKDLSTDEILQLTRGKN